MDLELEFWESIVIESLIWVIDRDIMIRCRCDFSSTANALRSLWPISTSQSSPSLSTPRLAKIKFQSWSFSLTTRWMPMFSSICLDSFSMRILSQRCQWLWLDSLGCWCPSARGGQNDFYFQGGGDYWLNWLSLSRLRRRWGRSCGLNWLMRSSDRWWAFSNLIYNFSKILKIFL